MATGTHHDQWELSLVESSRKGRGDSRLTETGIMNECYLLVELVVFAHAQIGV